MSGPRRDGKRLILFDIDGTLLVCGPQMRPIFRSAMLAAYGVCGDLDGYDFAGKTDDQIVVELATEAGVERERIDRELPRMRRLYVERLERDLDARQMRLLPGVRDLLDRLSAQHGVAIGLLTGNWELGARVKLSRFDLNRYFPFGAFGDGSSHRRHLPPVALERAREVVGRPLSAHETLIVGDTALDVDCARAHGIESLAVATGTASAEELSAAGADWVCHNLESAVPPLAGLAVG